MLLHLQLLSHPDSLDLTKDVGLCSVCCVSIWANMLTWAGFAALDPNFSSASGGAGASLFLQLLISQHNQ